MAVSLSTWLRRTGAEAAFAALGELLEDHALFVVDADRNVVHWSAGAERLLGFKAEEMLGAHCLKGFRCPACMAGCGVAERGVVRDVPLACHHKDGDSVDVRKSARAFFDADGRFAGAIELLRVLPATPPAPPRSVAAPAPVSFHGLLSRDPRMLAAIETIRNVAETEATILVRGESGTGKELVAQAIHAESRRRNRRFVAVNCAAFTASLLESELFGHVRGAFTGATADRTGIFAQADGGTLFLDEVAELPLELQSKLLRVLQERTFTPVGGTRPVKVDVRIVAATHKALREEVKAGRFREDLMFRLRVVPVFLPPLRERPEDVALLLDALVAAANRRGPHHVTGLAPETRRRLLAWRWPGNVRELQNVVEYMFAVSRAAVIPPDALPPEFGEASAEPARVLQPPASPVPGWAPPAPVSPVTAVPVTAVPVTGSPLAPVAPPAARAAPPRTAPDRAAAAEAALARTGGNVGEAAALLGVSRPTFWRWRTRGG